MSDPVSVTSATIILLSQGTKAYETLLTSHSAVEDVKRIELDLQVNLRKFQVWQELWSGENQGPNVNSEALWGLQGWANIKRMLNNIVNASKTIERSLFELGEYEKARSKWKSAVKSLRSKKKPQSELRSLATVLSNAIDELWIYSETVFDSLHGVMAQEPRYPLRDMLLKSALQSRAGSLQLYSLCAKSTVNFSLAMDLLDAGSNSLSPTSPLHDHSNPSMHVFYQLFTQTPNIPTEFQKLIVENAPQASFSRTETDRIILDSADFELFDLRTEKVSIEIPKQGFLRIPEKPAARISLPSTPERLAKVLATLEETSYLSAKEHFSIGAKIELAFKIVETGFFLLGTPWFSSLSSRNLLRLKGASRQQHSFMLEIQTLDFSDLLFDDPEALAETSQLYLIGVLLMEIALEKTDFTSHGDDPSLELDLMKFLPGIEQSMGAQYCKATAFCLQHRQPRMEFSGPEKYTSPQFGKWESYLAELLQDYHSQVFLRLEELRNI